MGITKLAELIRYDASESKSNKKIEDYTGKYCISLPFQIFLLQPCISLINGRSDQKTPHAGWLFLVN